LWKPKAASGDLLAAFLAQAHTREALFGVMLLLLFSGIHNAWDAVAYHVFVNTRGTNTKPRRDETEKEDQR
jgi:hypothetical protein